MLPLLCDHGITSINVSPEFIDLVYENNGFRPKPPQFLEWIIPTEIKSSDKAKTARDRIAPE
jgi:hypothetical protein